MHAVTNDEAIVENLTGTQMIIPAACHNTKGNRFKHVKVGHEAGEGLLLACLWWFDCSTHPGADGQQGASASHIGAFLLER